MSDAPLNEQSAIEQGAPTSTTAQATAVAHGPGAQLAAHRQARGFTIEQVANQLNLAPRQIQALEEDNYAALPGIVIARGFIRAYAKLLKVDPAPLVSQMQGEAATPMESSHIKQALSGSFSESHLPTAARSGSLSKGVIATMLAVVVIIAAFVAYWLGWLPGLSEFATETSEKAKTPHSSQAPQTNAPSISHSEILPPAAAQGAQSAAFAAKEASLPNHPVTNEAQAPVPAAASASAEASVAPAPIQKQESHDNTPVKPETGAPQGKNLLVIKAQEDTWVEARAADNTVLISHLIPAGSTETLSVNKPISLTIGNAGGVEMTLRGNPVDVKRTAKNNVAHINLK